MFLYCLNLDDLIEYWLYLHFSVVILELLRDLLSSFCYLLLLRHVHYDQSLFHLPNLHHPKFFVLVLFYFGKPVPRVGKDKPFPAGIIQSHVKLLNRALGGSRANASKAIGSEVDHVLACKVGQVLVRLPF